MDGIEIDHNWRYEFGVRTERHAPKEPRIMPANPAVMLRSILKAKQVPSTMELRLLKEVARSLPTVRPASGSSRRVRERHGAARANASAATVGSRCLFISVTIFQQHTAARCERPEAAIAVARPQPASSHAV